MEVTIEYNAESAVGRIIASDDVPNNIWNRINDTLLGIQPDIKMVGRTIVADWPTVLASASSIAFLRKKYGFTTKYNEMAKQLLGRYRKEVMAIRETEGTMKLNLSADEVGVRLKERGFTERKLKPYQIRDVMRMVQLSNGANFSVPGAGKTTVAFAAHILTRKEDTRLLVIAPKNAFSAWDDVVIECMRADICEHWKFVRLIGGREAIRDKLRYPPIAMILSYDQLPRVQDIISRLLTNYKVHVILDESHRMKSGDRSQRGGTLLRLAHLPVRRDILSGTPIPKSIADIGAQIEFLWPGQSLGWKITEAERPHDVLKGLYVRTTKHELGLPPVKRRFIPVQMSQAQMALYSIIRQEVIKQLSGIKTKSNIDLSTSRRSVMRLLQVSSNPILVVKRLTDEQPQAFKYEDTKIEAIFKTIVEEFDSPKILKACDLARELAAKGQKSVIWTSFTENVERIAELLSDLGATYIHGGVDTGDETDPNTREGRVRMFNDINGPCKVLVANPAACSEGISLHRVCHNAIYVDRSYNAAHYLQSVDRIHRLGLPDGSLTYIYVLESVAPSAVGAIDYSVRRRLITKLKTMYEVLKDYDLHRLALDEEEAEAPVDYDISYEDLADIIDELVGNAPPPEENEVG